MLEVMLKNLQILFSVSLVSLFMIGIVALLAVMFIFARRDSLESKYRIRIILFLYVVLAVIFIIVFCLSFLTLSMHLLFSIIYFLCWIIGLDQVITNYLALTGTLIGFSFIPKKIAKPILKLFPTDFYKDKNVITNILFGFLDVMNIKTIIYLISFVLVFIAGIETLSNKMIFYDVLLWINIKPIVLESVVSFIAFDRFYKAMVEDFNKNKPKIISLYNIVADYFKRD
ncbi:UNVERIFIED_CONTAM: small-conductance mechanosensitive channel [Paenibacillus sp. PvR008]